MYRWLRARRDEAKLWVVMEAFTREERELLREYEFHHRLRRESLAGIDLGDSRYHSRKLAGLRVEIALCGHARQMIGLLRLRDMMSTDDAEGIAHLLPALPPKATRFKPKKRVRNLQMKAEPLASVSMPKKPGRKLEIVPEPPVLGPYLKPRRRKLGLN